MKLAHSICASYLIPHTSYLIPHTSYLIPHTSCIQAITKLAHSIYAPCMVLLGLIARSVVIVCSNSL